MDIASYAYADEAHTRIDSLEVQVTKSGSTVLINGDVVASGVVQADGSIILTSEVQDDSHNHSIDTITGLQELLNTKIDSTLIGVQNGLATLNESGLIPTSQLPSYVDDVLEFSTFEDLPEIGETGKIYVITQTKIIYRWSGSDYVSISSENAKTADKLSSARLISLVGAVTGTINFDGSQDIVITTELSNHRHDISEIDGLEEALQNAEFKYSNPTPMPSALGGYSAGDTFQDATLEQLFTNLLYPYQFPSFTSFSMQGQNTTLEVGDTVTGGLRTFTFNISNDVNVKGLSISINDLSRNATLGQSLQNNNNAIVNIGDGITKNSQDSHSFRIFAENTKSQSFNRTYTINWRWRIYFGTNDFSELDEQDIKGLQNSSLSTSPNGTKAFLAGGYKYIAYPTLFGLRVSFKDADTGFSVAMEPAKIISIQNDFGVRTNYYLHRTTNPIVGALRITIG